MSKKQNIKAKQVDYFAVPKPLWKGIKHLFPEPNKRGRSPVHDRWALNAIWYVLWTSCQWKALKREWFGVSSSTAHARLQLWQEIGIFDRIMTEMVKFAANRRVQPLVAGIDEPVANAPATAQWLGGAAVGGG
jgi:transposase